MTPLMAFLMFGLPVVVPAGGLLLTAVLVRPSESELRGWRSITARVAPPVLAVLAFWAADIGLNQFHPVWDRDGTNRYLAVAVAAGLVGLIHATVGRGWVAAVGRMLLGVGVAVTVLLPLAGGPYVSWSALVLLAIAAGIWTVGAGRALDRSAAGLPRLTGPATMVLGAAAVAPGIALSGYVGGASFAGSLAAIAGGLALTNLLPIGKRVERSGLHTVWLAVFAAILLVTYAYNEVPSVWALVVMAAAPFGVLVGRLVRCPWRATLAAILATAMIGGAGTVAAGLATGDDADEDPYYGY